MEDRECILPERNMMKKVYYVVAVVLAMAILIGFVLPMLVSAKADIAVLLAVGIMIFVAMAFLHFIHAKVFKKVVDKKDETA